MNVDDTWIGSTSDVIAGARMFHTPVSTHAHPLLHQHVTFAWPDTSYIEMFPDNRPFEPSHQLVEASTFERAHNGHLLPPTDPGTGLRLNLSAVHGTARRHQTVTAD